MRYELRFLKMSAKHHKIVQLVPSLLKVHLTSFLSIFADLSSYYMRSTVSLRRWGGGVGNNVCLSNSPIPDPYQL